MRHALAVAAILIAVIATAAAEPAEPTLPIALDRQLDARQIVREVERDLGRPVTVVERCDAVPCAIVSVVDQVEGHPARPAVMVEFLATDNSRRTRTIALGDDRDQWSIVSALLIGNLVRDEAADLLTTLTPPPRAEPSPPAPSVVLSPPTRAPEASPPPPLARSGRGFAIGFVPGLSSDFANTARSHCVSIDVIAGVSGGSSCLSISGVADVENGDVSGTQIGGVAAVARRLMGVQVAGVAAVAGELHGVQIAGTAAVANGTRPAGVQIAGVVAVANATNVQIGGVASVARSAHTQIAGVVNTARVIDGLQIAPINVARGGRTVQIGLINVHGSADGESFGLINIVRGGRLELEANLDSGRYGAVMVRHGGRRWHNVYGIGGRPIDEASLGMPTNRSDDLWMYGVGLGPEFALAGATRLDVELMTWNVNHGARHTDHVSLLNQLRVSLAHSFGRIAVVVGGAVNVYVSNDERSPILVERRTMGDAPTSYQVAAWPSVFGGLRF